MIAEAVKERMRSVLETIARAFTGENKLEVRWGRDAATDFSRICLPESIPAAGELAPGVSCTPGEAWLGLRALLAHEAGHLLFTDRTVWEEVARKKKETRIALNIIEDARVERAMANAFPGTLRWFRFLNEYVFVHLPWERLDPAERLVKALAAYAVVGRVPDCLTREELEAVREAAPHIDRGRRAATTAEAAEAAREVARILRRIGKLPAARSLPPPPAGSDSPLPAPDVGLDPRREPALPPATPEVDGLERSPGSFEGESLAVPGEPSERKETGGAGEKLLAGMDDLLEESAREVAAMEEKGEGENWEWRFAEKALPPDPAVRLRLEQAVKPLVRRLEEEFRRALEGRHRLTRRNLRRGSLDPSSLWKTAVGNPALFRKRSLPPGDPTDLAVYLLVDCSGSMMSGARGPWPWCRTRQNYAASAALLMHLALARLGVPHAITGFTTTSWMAGKSVLEVLHLRVKGFSDATGPVEALFSVRKARDNADGFSIRRAVEELADVQSKKRVLIVISDGVPSAGDYSGPRAFADTARAVREAEKRGVQVLGLYIGSRPDEARLLYPRLICLASAGDLPRVLARVLKEVVLNN